tara:strand:- start:11064 stop:11789 length:726 start_codon:yes stop_codon:yes gene_type:complete
MPKVLKVNDVSDDFHIKHKIFDLPFRLLLNSKSQIGMGKTTLILNLILNPEMGYSKFFKGKHIWVISNNKLDNKLKMLAEYKEIPDSNIMSYDENTLMQLYDDLEDDFLEDKSNKEFHHRLIIFDDVGYSNSLKNKQAGVISKLISNGRHLGISQIYTTQRFSMCSSILKSNVTAACFGNTSMAELELISDSFNYLESKKEFIKLFRKYTDEPRSFLCINFTNDAGIYQDKEFTTIKINSV